MDVLHDIKLEVIELQPKLMDVIFHVSLLRRLVCMIRTPQSFSMHFFSLNLFRLSMKYLS